MECQRHVFGFPEAATNSHLSYLNSSYIGPCATPSSVLHVLPT